MEREGGRKRERERGGRARERGGRERKREKERGGGERERERYVSILNIYVCLDVY